MSKPNSILHRRRSSKYNPNPFGVSVRRAGRRTLVSPITRVREVDLLPEQPIEAMGLIQGQKPGSMYEWRLAQALDAVGLSYQFQVAIAGGRSMRGGQVVDFVVDTVPLPTPVFADGEHWHEGSLAREDSYKRAFLNAEMAGIWNPWVSFFGPDLHDLETAIRLVREKFL